MDKQSKIILLIGIVAIIFSIILSINLKHYYQHLGDIQWTPIDSFETKAIPVEITGSKYPYLKVKLLNDNKDEFEIRLGHKLYSTKDTIKVRIYINTKKQWIYGKVIQTDEI